jgi:hypothetical protein
MEVGRTNTISAYLEPGLLKWILVHMEPTWVCSILKRFKAEPASLLRTDAIYKIHAVVYYHISILLHCSTYAPSRLDAKGRHHQVMRSNQMSHEWIRRRP